ncbi:MAG: cytochrome c biogenesis protein ResB [Candidatus Eremiobacteraeota bacterium]|nr:cytochrome c biogenesis protein ResB [Candidatus Eremiobacteraeota bacterium]
MTAVARDFVRTFSNVLFAVSLFAIWAVLTLLGVVIDQNQDPQEYFGAYPVPLARAILRLGFDNVYHSPWYIGIIGLILLSLTVCTFKRVIPARLPPLRPVKVDKIPLNASFEVAGVESSVRQRVEAFFARHGWQVRKRTFDGTEWTFADRHNWARRGVLVAHVGFVIIAAGTTIYWARGFAGETAILTGQTVTPSQTSASLTLHDFNYRIQPIATKSGIVYQPIDYVSHVTAIGRDGIPHRATIRVNHPIDVDGTFFYQASYGFAMRFTVTHDGVPVADLSSRQLEEGQGLSLPQSARSVQYAQFVPTIDKLTGMPSADPRINRPGVVLNVFDGDQPLGTTLLPLGQRLDLGQGFSIVPRQYTLYSGIQYRYDPGVPLVGIGAFVLLAGLCISLYLLPARLFVQVSPGPAGCTVGVAAMTVKGYEMFEQPFSELIEEMKKGE